jgi:hypothetical protein
MPETHDTKAVSPTTTVGVSGAVEKITPMPDTARGITVHELTLLQHIPGQEEPAKLLVRVEQESLVDGLAEGARVIGAGRLGKREGWHTVALLGSLGRVPAGEPMDLLNEVVIVGKRVGDPVPKTVETLTLYHLYLEVDDGTRQRVSVFKKLFDKLAATEDGQMLRVKGELEAFVGKGADHMYVRATDIEVVTSRSQRSTSSRSGRRSTTA